MTEHRKFLANLVELQEAKMRLIQQQIFEAAYLSQAFSGKEAA